MTNTSSLTVRGINGGRPLALRTRSLGRSWLAEIQWGATHGNEGQLAGGVAPTLDAAITQAITAARMRPGVIRHRSLVGQDDNWIQRMRDHAR